jgi:predicted porin
VYANGPLFASLSYETAKSFAGAAAAASTALAAGPAIAADKSANATKLGLGYNYGAGNINFIYENTGGNALENSALDRSAYYLAGTYKMGNNTLKAAFGKANDGASAANTGAKQYTLGVDHAMSKRTSVYALYTKMNNDDGAAYGLGGNGTQGAYANGTAGTDPSAWSFGMKHAF